MKKPITYTVMLTYFVWGLNIAVNASAETLERWQMNANNQPVASVFEHENTDFAQLHGGFAETRVELTDPGGGFLPDPDTGMELAADNSCE